MASEGQCIRSVCGTNALGIIYSAAARLIGLFIETMNQFGQNADQVIAKAWGKAPVDPQSDAATGSNEPPDLLASGVHDWLSSVPA
jgi:hypothetical protein